MAVKLPKATLSAWVRLMKSQQILLERVEADLKAADLPPVGWYDVLIELHWAQGNLRQYEIGERVLLSKHTLSRLLDHLEMEGLAARMACPEDRRGANVSLTKAGKALLRKMWPVYARAIETHFASQYSQDELKQLSALLTRLVPKPEAG